MPDRALRSVYPNNVRARRKPDLPPSTDRDLERRALPEPPGRGTTVIFSARRRRPGRRGFLRCLHVLAVVAEVSLDMVILGL